MEKLFQIYTMYVNRVDLLREAITALGEYASRVVVIDNSTTRDLALSDLPAAVLPVGGR